MAQNRSEIYLPLFGRNLDCQDLLETARRQYLDVSLENAMDLDSLTSVLQEGTVLP